MSTAADDYDVTLRRIAEERLGRVLCGKYTLDEVLGVGGMAAVYAGTHRNGHRVAIKVLHPEIAVVQDLRARFLREGYAANQVGHAGTVRVLDDDMTDDGTVFLVMELLEGATLADLVRRGGGTMSAEALVPLVVQLLDVLDSAHRAGIVHRDIKPDNVFVEIGDRVKILDFGVARVRRESKTRTGRMLGTPEFMAPEQARGQTRAVDAQSDIYAVGALCFRALAGRNVHEGETPEMAAILAATEPAPRLLDVSSNIAAPLAAVIDRALVSEKVLRWESATAMREALETALPPSAWRSSLQTASDLKRFGPSTDDSTLRPSRSTDGVATPARHGRGRTRHVVVGAALVLSVVMVLAATWRTQRRSDALAPAVATPDVSADPARSIESAPIPSAPTVSLPTTSNAAASAGPVPVASAPRRVPPLARPAPAAVVNDCDPPWRLTATGTREYKLECFKR